MKEEGGRGEEGKGREKGEGERKEKKKEKGEELSLIRVYRLDMYMTLYMQSICNVHVPPILE